MEPIHFSTVRPPRRTHCAYCGAPRTKDNPVTKEHMPPDCMCVSQKRLTVPTCEKCNTRESENVAEFRNFICMCGPIPNDERRMLWEKAKNSFNEKDGRTKLENLYQRIQRSNGEKRVYPMQHQFFRSIVRNQVRALSWWHSILTPLPDDRLYVELYRHNMFPGIDSEMPDADWYYAEKDRLEYWFSLVGKDGFHSWWILRYFNSCSVFAAVFDNEESKAIHTSIFHET